MSKSVDDRFKVVPAVYVVFKNAEDEILLLRRAHTGYHDGEYSLPAGHVDGGESAVRAAVREAKEEVGVVLEAADLRLVHTMHRFSVEPEPHERIDLFFEASKWTGEIQNLEPEKCNELRWVRPEALPINTVPEVGLALKKIEASEPYSDYELGIPVI